MAYTPSTTFDVEVNQILQTVNNVTTREALKKLMDLIKEELDAIDDEI
jgi:hypothetical protein